MEFSLFAKPRDIGKCRAKIRAAPAKECKVLKKHLHLLLTRDLCIASHRIVAL